MSSATIARPSAVSWPDTAKLLLPTSERSGTSAGRGPCRHRQAAQVDDARVGQRGVAARVSGERRVPARAVVREQRVQRRRQVRLDAPHRQFALVARILQVEVHRVAGERRIGQRPRLRFRAQQQVGPRPHLQCIEARIDAVDVGLRHVALVAERSRRGRASRARACDARDAPCPRRSRRGRTAPPARPPRFGAAGPFRSSVPARARSRARAWRRSRWRRRR